MRLPAEVKAKWLEALRSGKYKQTQDVLYSPETKGFCCLGVLEHCMLDGHVEKMYENKVNMIGKFAGLPSKKFWDGIGLQYRDDEHIYVEKSYSNNEAGWYIGGIIEYLANLNDYGANFSTIADVIETEVDSY